MIRSILWGVGALSIVGALGIAATIPFAAFPTGSYQNGDSTIAVLLVYLLLFVGISTFAIALWYQFHKGRFEAR